MSMGLNISPSFWQPYINMILDCLQSGKYCEATVVNPDKEITYSKIRRFIKSII